MLPRLGQRVSLRCWVFDEFDGLSVLTGSPKVQAISAVHWRAALSGFSKNGRPLALAEEHNDKAQRRALARLL